MITATNQDNKEASESTVSQVRVRFDQFVEKWLPARFHDVTLEKIDPQFREIIADRISIPSFPDGHGLILIGDVGVGKTAAMYVILKAYLWWRAQRIPLDAHEVEFNQWMFGDGGFAFMSHFELVKELRNHNRIDDPDKATFPDRLNRRVMFIDDLGRGYDTDWNMALLDEFFDYRWANCLPTFISTNKTPDELRNWPDWDRIVDRLADPAWMTPVRIGDDTQSRRKV